MPESLEVLEAVEAGYFRLADMPPIVGVTKQRVSQFSRRPDFPAAAKLVGTVVCGAEPKWRSGAMRCGRARGGLYPNSPRRLACLVS